MLNKNFIGAFLTIALALFPKAHADIYVDSFGKTYHYSKTVPYRTVARVTYHNSFANIYLDDGSVWYTEGYFSKEDVCTWLINDPIVIYPSDKGIHPEDYYLYNERTGTRAYVDISCPSAPGDVTYLSLLTIDYTTNMITLQDGFGTLYNYEVGSGHMYKLSNWGTNDCIILGWNKDLYSYNDLYFPYILINMNKLEHIDCEYVEYTY